LQRCPQQTAIGGEDSRELRGRRRTQLRLQATVVRERFELSRLGDRERGPPHVARLPAAATGGGVPEARIEVRGGGVRGEDLWREWREAVQRRGGRVHERGHERGSEL